MEVTLAPTFSDAINSAQHSAAGADARLAEAQQKRALAEQRLRELEQHVSVDLEKTALQPAQKTHPSPRPQREPALEPSCHVEAPAAGPDIGTPTLPPEQPRLAAPAGTFRQPVPATPPTDPGVADSALEPLAHAAASHALSPLEPLVAHEPVQMTHPPSSEPPASEDAPRERNMSLDLSSMQTPSGELVRGNPSALVVQASALLVPMDAEEKHRTNGRRMLVGLEEPGHAGQTQDRTTALRKALADLPSPIYILGLCDTTDEFVLRISLHLAAGRPRERADDAAFDEMDRSTWTLKALQFEDIDKEPKERTGAPSTRLEKARMGSTTQPRALQRRGTIRVMAQKKDDGIQNVINELRRELEMSELEGVGRDVSESENDEGDGLKATMQECVERLEEHLERNEGQEKEAMRMRKLLHLQQYAGNAYSFPIDQFINVLPLSEESSNNIAPKETLNDYIFPMDKSGLCTSQSAIDFKLVDNAFGTGPSTSTLAHAPPLRLASMPLSAGNAFNSRAKLLALKRLVFRREYGEPDLSPDKQSELSERLSQATSSEHTQKILEQEFDYYSKALAGAQSDALVENYKSVAKLSFNLKCTPLNAVTLPSEARKAACIPELASFYCFCFPSVRDTITDDMVRAAGINEFDPFVQFLQTGAFFYCSPTRVGTQYLSVHRLPDCLFAGARTVDFKYDLIQVNALCWSEVPSGLNNEQHHVMSRAALCLGESSVVPMLAIEMLADLGRWKPVTIDLISDFGFRFFGWINPCELIGEHIFSPNGGFIFLHKDDYAPESETVDGWLNEVAFTSRAKANKLRSRFFPVVRPEANLAGQLDDATPVSKRRNSKGPHSLSQPVSRQSSFVRFPSPGSPHSHRSSAAPAAPARSPSSSSVEQPSSLEDLLEKDKPRAFKLVEVRLEERRKKRLRPEPVVHPLFIPELTAGGDAATTVSKFTDTEEAKFADGSLAALGLPSALGKTVATFKSEQEVIANQLRRLQEEQDNHGQPYFKPAGASSTEWDVLLIEAECRAVTAKTIERLAAKGCFRLAKGEMAQDYVESLLWYANYILREEAKEEEVDGNGTDKEIRDKGHEGWTLDTFCEKQEAKTAALDRAEVFALRLYTSPAFRIINDPLRGKTSQNTKESLGSAASDKAPSTQGTRAPAAESTASDAAGEARRCTTDTAPHPPRIMPMRSVSNDYLRSDENHPLAFTVLMISRALKKLRACHMQSTKKFRQHYLWRGLRDRRTSDGFADYGGVDMACMSTSSDLSVVAKYAKSEAPLIFRFKIVSPMELGADIRWLSLFPNEAEYLYPPLTYIKQLYKQEIKYTMGLGFVVTVSPSFPS